ncbi:hypothetical protein Tco_0809615 [Tanacetum coccineum]
MRGGVEERSPPIIPSNIDSNITLNNKAPSVAPMHTEMQTIEEAFVTANYSQLEPLIRRIMEALRLQGVATWLNYSSEDVDEKREMKAPPEVSSQPSITTREPITRNIPLFLASHLRETERRRRTLSPRGTTGVNGDPPNNAYPRTTFIPPPANPNRSYSLHQEYTVHNYGPPNQTHPSGVMYYTGCPEGGYRNNEGSPSPLVRCIEEFQLPGGLRIPPHVGYYDGKGDPDDFIHAFEGATKTKK